VQAVPAEPPAGEFAPAGHGSHVPALLAPATFEYVPARQRVQLLGPATVLYFPASHAVHTPPLGPVYPALQAQFVCDPLDAAANEFAGHRLQLGLPSGDHCPSGHARHVSLPVAP
jgi:hypothetical protein